MFLCGAFWQANRRGREAESASMGTKPLDFGTQDPISLVDPRVFADPEQLIAAYFNSSTVGLCILDTELRFLAINDALAQINGIPAADHIGKTVRDVLQEFATIVEPELHRVLLTGKPVLNFEVAAILPASKRFRQTIDHFFPMSDSNGKVTRVGAVVLDVTRQRALQEAFENLNLRLSKQVERLQMLLDVSSLVATNWDLPKVFPRISARIRRVLRQEYSSYSLHDANTGLLVRQAMDFPLGRGLTSDVFVATGSPPSGDVLQASTPRVFSKDELQSFEGETARTFLAEGMQSLCCVPLLRPKGALGVFVLASTRKHAFHLDDVNLLEQVAAQLAIAIENHRAASEIEALKKRLEEERKYLSEEIRSQGDFAEIIGDSTALKQVLDQVATVASSDATVLVLGETGTGKELIARAIHRMSRRKDGPFIKLNCAAIPTGLLESELFGHEKGAFTGAISQKIGRMELADKGTLFLDEVGEIPLEVQPKLLRVLQDQEFERLGSNRTIRVNVRLVAATNRDLAKAATQHQFRTDLYYRLSVFPIRLPSLRERREDIPLLVRHFVRKFALRMDRHLETVPKETMRALVQWDWPGNVRELENLMERSVILSEGKVLRVPLMELQASSESDDKQPDHTLDNAERRHIIRVLRETGGVLSGPKGAARRLGLKRTTLQSKMQRLKILRKDYSDPDF
jgi:formate hydrogenlyase transcriptional activator